MVKKKTTPSGTAKAAASRKTTARPKAAVANKSAARKKAAAPAQKKAAAPARKKAAAPARKKAAAPARKKAPSEAATRAELIAVAAYLRAEKRGFAPGGEHEDWLLAEREVDLRLRAPEG